MESKKGRPEPRWLVILEDIRSQSRATLEAVESSRLALEGRFGVSEQKTESRFTVVEAAIRSIGEGVASLESRLGALERRFDLLDQESRSRDTSLEMAIRELKVSVQQNSVDIRDLAGRVEALKHLEDRVSALERRGA